MAGIGCVGGWLSEHGNTAYFQGGTTILNEQLAVLANDEYLSFKIILHVGASMIDDPEEGTSSKPNPKLSVDWAVQKGCPFETVRTGRCRCKEQNVFVHIWVANDIRLKDLKVPAKFDVESGGELDEFVKKHAVQQK
ncbi:MAG: hypothetical protein SGI77_28215 [Pirellulaceae bacterium]|nr:hypothetical protein [Pirellulaceae bacterium]